MRRIPAPNGTQAESSEDGSSDAGPFRRPTVSGMVTAGASVLVLAATSLLLLVPAVFYLMPLPAEADALTLCLPGLGPVQRFQDGLHPSQEELTFIHEAVHARECRSLGAAWYARQALDPRGRLRLEARALCAETTLQARRGADPARLRDWAVEILRSEYFEGGAVTLREISEAVDATCSQGFAE